MGETSKIEWTDATWNPWQGCTKVSPACEHCYMFRDLKRYGRDGSIVVRSKPPTFNLPLKTKQGGEFAIAPGSKLFTCSWSDWFHEAADPWRDEAWAIARKRRDVTIQIVTKRVDRAAQCLPADWGDGYPNVWIIATVENQEWAEKRIPALLRLPAAVRGLSIEPMLGPIDLIRVYNSHQINENALDHIDWVIGGGESGPGARPMHPSWVRSLRDQCLAADIPFFFKQWGDWLPEFVAGTAPKLEELASNQSVAYGDGKTNHVRYTRVGKANAGRLLDGREWSQFPKQMEAV